MCRLLGDGGGVSIKEAAWAAMILAEERSLQVVVVSARGAHAPLHTCTIA